MPSVALADTVWPSVLHYKGMLYSRHWRLLHIFSSRYSLGICAGDVAAELRGSISWFHPQTWSQLICRTQGTAMRAD